MSQEELWIFKVQEALLCC